MSQSNQARRAVINVPAALRRMGGDRELLVQIAVFFLEDASTQMERLHSCQNLRDAEGVRQAAHGLKGMASNFDALALQQLCAEIEELARREQLNVVDSKMESIEAELKKVRDELKKELLNQGST